MKKGTGIALGIVALALLALGGKAASDSDDEEKDDDNPTPNPNLPTPDNPPKNLPKTKDYVGSGYDWPNKARFPNERSFGLFLQQLGYQTNPASAGWNVIGAKFMGVVSQFQKDYNVARKAQTVTEPPPKALSTDGLIGKNTIAAMLNAEHWTQTLGVNWMDLVALA